MKIRGEKRREGRRRGEERRGEKRDIYSKAWEI
jgi:hypothetical protein